MNYDFKKFCIKTLLFMLPVALLFEIMYRLGLYPIISNNSVFDRKVFEIATHPLKKVEFLAMGSSVANFELKSAIMVKNLNLTYYNFAAWSLQMTDDQPYLKELVTKYQPKYVLLGTTISDFTRESNPTLSAYFQTSRRLRDFPRFFYFKNYNSITTILRRYKKGIKSDFDKQGGEPTNFPIDTTWVKYWQPYKDPFPTRYTEPNYQALKAMGAFLASRHIKFIFVQFPIAAEYNRDPRRFGHLTKHFSRCKAIVEEQGGTYLNYNNPRLYPNTLFFDRYHMIDAGGNQLTRQLVADLKKLVK